MTLLGIILFIVFFKEIMTAIMIGATTVATMIGSFFAAIFKIFD